jgi:exopolysaccharide biosynthesis protein
MKFNLPKNKLRVPKFRLDKHFPIIIILILVIGFGFFLFSNRITTLQNLISNLTQEKDKNLGELEKIKTDLETLKNQDQLKRNDELQKEIGNIQKTYNKAVSIYESLLDLKAKTNDTKELDALFAKALSELSKKDFTSAESSLDTLAAKIDEEDKKLAASFSIPQNVPESNAAPGSGYSRQSVNVESLGSYMVSLVAGDLGSTKVIVDTAADSDCANDCPVLPLATYVSRNGAHAGINGTYFCPADYPSCAGKTNSYDLLVMNYKKTYFNSGNNVYSNNPAVIFGDGYVRFVSSASQWGRDTSPNGVISNYPLLVFNGNVVFGGDDDPKKGSKGGRSFVANKGNTVYIGVVHSATVAESARVLKTLGMENAMNLDDGGSTALYSGGYKVGPGRNLPNVILFVNR